MARTRSPLRHSIRLIRAVWRYRSALEAHGEQYVGELATAVRGTIDVTPAGRLALRAYRLAMRALVAGALLLVGLAVLAGVLARGLPLPATVAIVVVPAALALLVGWWWLTWGAPLRWLDEYAAPPGTQALADAPARLGELLAKTRGMADVPARVREELDELAQAGTAESAANR
jgi:hypothetical protein